MNYDNQIHVLYGALYLTVKVGREQDRRKEKRRRTRRRWKRKERKGTAEKKEGNDK